MTYPQNSLPTLEALYRLGTNICAEIEKFHPDVVIGLAHSGWMPVVVAQTLWAETRQDPFPPATRTNIGLEKASIYETRYGKSTPAFCCGDCCDGPGRISHYLAWVADQDAWLKTLRTQIEAVFHTIPQRTLVVDDVFGGYRSGYATLALLEKLFPNVVAYVYAGNTDLTDQFVTSWLSQFAPVLINGIPGSSNNPPSQVRYSSPWHELLKPLITGTEDIATERLDWKYLSSESPAIKALAEFVPADIALLAPDWTKTLACTYALQRLKDEIKDDAVVQPGEDDTHLSPISHLAILPEERLAARAWQQGRVTNADIVQIYGDSPENMKKGLHDVSVKHEWLTQGETPDAIYFPLASFESWINIYRLPEQEKPEISVQGFAEFLLGEVWAGVYPISDNRMDVELLKHLLSTDVNTFIDLTNPKDFHRKLSYRKTLLQVSQEIGRSVDVYYFPLPFHASPARQQVQRILKFITQTLRSGKRIYIHAGNNLEGRTPLILACLLIERGYTAELALAEVTAFWQKTLHFLIRMPLSGSQHKFIQDW